MHENRFNEYRIPSGMLIVFLEKALTLIHMETHLDDVSHIRNVVIRFSGSPVCLNMVPIGSVAAAKYVECDLPVGAFFNCTQ